MEIFEWTEQTPVTANNMNEMQNKLNNNIKEAVENQYNLVTDGSAVKTGRQVDGKDEYEVKINCGSGPNNASKTTNFNTENIIITDYYVIGISSSNEIVYVPNSTGSGQYFNVFFTNNVIALSSNQDRSRFTCYAYIKYINKN